MSDGLLLGPSNFGLVRSEHAHASYPGLSFVRPGSAPIWGGKKGEFKDCTSMSMDRVSVDPLLIPVCKTTTLTTEYFWNWSGVCF